MLTPSRILGLMSCKMRRLQLTRTDGARTRLLAQHVPSSTPPSFSTHLAHLLQGAPSWCPFLVVVRKPSTGTHHFLTPQVARNGEQGLILVLRSQFSCFRIILTDGAGTGTW